MIFSRHRRKIEPRRRFGSREFRTKLKLQSVSHKKIFMAGSFRLRSWVFSVLSWRSRLLRLLLLIGLTVSLYFLVISDRFLITEVAVTGNRQVSAEQIQAVLDTLANNRTFFIKKNHYLLMTKGRVNEAITSAISEVKEVLRSDRQGLRKIELEIRERNAGFVLVVKGKKYLVDEDGNVVKEVGESQGLPVVTDQAEEDLVLGESLPNPKMIAFIISMHKSWTSKINSNVAGIKVLGKGAGEVQIVSSEGWAVFFDVNRSVLSQLSNLAIILNRQIPSSDRANLAYIDMRSEKWVYYCYKGAPCNAEPTQ